MFNIIIEINESKSLTKHNLLVESVIQIKNGITINVETQMLKCVKTQKNFFRVYKKNYIWNPAIYSCENGKYSATTINDSVITYDEIIKETKTVSTNFNDKNATCKTKSFHILRSFLLITIALLIAVSIYCYLIK